MANNYYNFPVAFVPGTKVRSEQVNIQYAGVEAGFDLLPTAPASMVIGTSWFGTDVQGATVNEYLITTPDPQAALVNGQRVAFFATHTNDGAVTFNVDTLGVINAVDNDGTALVANDVISGQFYEFVFDNANTQWVRSLAGSDLVLGGVDTQIQYNDGGVFGGTAGFTFVKGTLVTALPGDLTVVGLVDGRDVAADGAAQDSHIADATIHFTEGSIDHTAIPNIGVNSHAAIDTHIADATIHFTEASIDHANILNIGVNTHAAIDTHIADATIHFTEASISITASQVSDFNAAAAAAAIATVEDEGVPLAGTATSLDFVGAGVVASGVGGTKTITIAGGGSGITVEDEGVPLATLATTLDFVGAGVVASGAGASKTITIAGGGAGDVTKVGTPVNNEIGVWTGDGTIEGDALLTWDGTVLTLGTGTVLKLGTGTDNFLIRHGGPDGLGAGLITISGGTGTSDGAHIQLFGEFHATQRNDMLFRVSTNAWMIWDESEGDLEMLTGTGSKLAALTLTTSQDAVFNRTVEIGEEILFTERADHVFTPVATRGILWLRDDAPNKLIFTDDAGTDFDLTDTGSGAFTEDGTNNSIFSAGAGTALLAGGIHNFLALDGAGVLITTGDRNIAIGDGAGGALVTDSDNVMIGSLSGENLTAADNTFVGAFSGRSVTTSPRNTAVGTLALGNTSAALVTPAADNTAIGYGSMSNFALGEAGQNTALGSGTLNFLTTGDENVAIGYNAGGNITTGTGNVMLGHTAGPTANQSDRLYIHNGNSDTPLIGGDFAASTLQINGTLEITAFNENEATFTGAAGTKNLDTSAATYFRASASMAGNAITFTFDNPPATGRVATITLEFNAASTATLTFPGSVQFPGGTEPSWSTGTDIVSFTTSDAGTTWNGFLGGLDFS